MRSGIVETTRDEAVITSLDIIVRLDNKLGAGGFGQVYEGNWLGTRVAVKVLDSDVPEWVRYRQSYTIPMHSV